MLFQYVDHLPGVPAHLTKNPADVDYSKIGKRDNLYNYTRWALVPELAEWVKQNITEYTDIAGVQFITGDVSLHRDKRRWALNYLLETGGDNVVTSWHRIPGIPDVDVLNPETAERALRSTTEQLEAHSIEPFRWHLISTEVLHQVKGTTKNRVAITVGFNVDNPLALLRNYR